MPESQVVGLPLPNTQIFRGSLRETSKIKDSYKPWQTLGAHLQPRARVMVEHCLAELCMFKTSCAITKATGYHINPDSLAEATSIYLRHQTSNKEKQSWHSTRNFSLTDEDS